MTEQDATQAATDPAPPPGRELARYNRRMAAPREYPEGALETCERLERVHPDWYVTYHRADNAIRGWEVAAGFYATQWDPPHGHKARLFGSDAKALSRAIEAVSSRCAVCDALLPVPPGVPPQTHKIPSGDDYCHASWAQMTRETWFSNCPTCGARLEVMVGSDVPPHQVDGTWCRTRCSQRTV